MLTRCTLRIIRVLVIAATWLTAPQLALSQDRDAVRDPAGYVAQLRERGLIIQTLQPQLQNIARVLVSYVHRTGEWGL